MKKLILFIATLFFLVPAFATHLKGGFFTYIYKGPGAGGTTNHYRVRLTVYMDADVNLNPQLYPTFITWSIFNNDDNQAANTVSAPRIAVYFLRKQRVEDCITNPPSGDFYRIAVYEIDDVELAQNMNGYTVSYQRCCRIIDIANISGFSNQIGNTYSVVIPGTGVSPDAPKNNSCTFETNDTAIVCRHNFFQISFHADDPDGDSLSYSFCDAWEGGSQQTPEPIPASRPPYFSISYSSGFGGTIPLGSQVTIDPVTGLISGIAPDVGEYVVTVCVNEFKNGLLVATNRKELHVKVADCSAVRATLQPEYVNCKDYNVIFFNNTPSGVSSSFWDFGVPGVTNDTSILAAPNFTYPDTGVYQVKLVVNKGERCADSMTAPVRVFPGFFPGFRWLGICANHPTQFFDTTRTLYGVVNYWSWDFGDLATTADTSHLKNPQYTYPAPGAYGVRFIVGTDKGCRDTIASRTVTILDKPPLNLPFKDTLICNGDTLQLHAQGTGAFSWTPNGQMIAPGTSDPYVWPATTTTYTVQLIDQGCVNRDTVQVRVVNFVTLQMNPDTTICLTDSVRLGATTDGLQFLWTPSDAMNNGTILRPMVLPSAALNPYTLVARIGHCTKTGTMRVKTVPYPAVSVSADTTICFRASVTLHGMHNSTYFEWSPKDYLTNANTLNPTARPPDTTQYVLMARDSLSGCPKPAYDTVTVNVMPRIFPNAGNDTMVIAGQPVQLHATGGVRYLWTPAIGLNRADTSDPIGIYDEDPEFIRYLVRVFDSHSCVDSATVRVRVFRTGPSIFVPTAFTPNGDGRNDIAKPIAVGMKRIEYFRIYNRWGQLVYETEINGAGWDGRINGKDQGTNVFVWVVKAVDFKDKAYFAKGTVTLIR